MKINETVAQLLSRNNFFCFSFKMIGKQIKQAAFCNGNTSQSCKLVYKSL